jgi:hypothetical protein
MITDVVKHPFKVSLDNNGFEHRTEENIETEVIVDSKGF